MCGIAGAIGAVTETTAEAVRRADARQVHRGPDDHGLWQSGPADGAAGCVLAHRRLAIIDLSPDAAQPMVDPNSGNVLVFNGELYNYRDLRARLEAEGVAFRSCSDTEVLLQAYGQWGERCVEQLRGMFAFIIWDARRRCAFMARDRLGIKPLYHCRIVLDGRPVLLVASEVRALLETGLVERRLDPEGLQTYLWNGFVVGPGTIIRSVRLLPAGCSATVDPAEAQVEPRRYWCLPAAGVSTPDDLQQALADAVGMRLVSDVPLGVFLSGGIDSSAVAALAVRSSSAPVRTFTIGFEESSFDESRYARSVARSLGTEHQEVRLTQSMFQQMLPDALDSLDQPTFDAINTYFVSRAVREAGITVALAGTGGDELFGGYRSFADVPRAAAAGRWLRPLPAPWLRRGAGLVARARAGRPGAVPPQTRWGKLGDVLASRGRFVAVYQTAYSLFTQDFQQQLLNGVPRAETCCGLPDQRAVELAGLIRDQPPWHAVSLMELSCFIGERLLRDTDAASMAVSLEVRVPLLDHVVVEQAAGQDPKARFLPLGRKRMLQEMALGGLDRAIFERPKSGFVLPIERWCREQLRDEVGATLGNEQACRAVGLCPDTLGRLWEAFQAGAPGLYWSRVWSLFVLLRWCNAHGVEM